MPETPLVRDSVNGDVAALERLYPAAFPDEDLLPLLRDLLEARADVLSLVACIDSDVAGHGAFTRCGLEGSNGKLALLGPLAVSPERQRQGVGSAIVLAGLERLRAANTQLVCVLGDPKYYGRFGFRRDSRIEPPYKLPPEWRNAWQSISLATDTGSLAGRLRVPLPWQQPALWAP